MMKLNSDDYRGIYAEMVDILGEDVVKKIHKYYKGQQINLPVKLYSYDYIEKYIVKNYNKKSLREMARELEYSDKWVSKLIKKIGLKEETSI